VIFDRSTGYNDPVTTTFLMALLLGLRHAADPDHLTAVSTLLLNEERSGPRRAALLGLAWGVGHATTLCAFGLPVILFSRHLPEAVQQGAEVVIGAIIVLLAARLLVRWWQGYFHLHPHRHGSTYHVHGHTHRRREEASEHPIDHAHAHPQRLGRSPAGSFGVGLVHGIGGSAGAGVLLMASTDSQVEGAVALVVFAGATALSMSLLSLAFAGTLAHGAVRRRLSQLVPVFGTAGLLFGVWYSVGALLG
jgi:cytochrome c biogenesis protein CcdA